MVKIGLVQINSAFSGQNYLPLSVGMLQAYAEKSLKSPEQFEFLLPIYTRLGVDDAVERLMEADIVAFSSYVWNYNISTAIAKKLKEKKPGVVIVFGGPHVPDKIDRISGPPDVKRIEEYLRKNSFIDIACHGEGERVFTALLENVFGDWRNIPSISFLDKNGGFVQTERIGRAANIDEFPSPYLEGTFDRLIAAYPEEHWIVIWETNRGCPFSCTFCDWGSAVAARVSKWELDRIYKEAEWFADHKIGYVYCADANFGILPRDLDIARHVAKIKGERGYPEVVMVQATKNAQERSYQVQKILADAGMNRAVVLSMQSLYEPTLKAIKRDNISLKVYEELQKRFAREGVETLTDLILGQPEETYESWVKGVDTLLNSGQHNCIRFNNLSLLPNAEMGDPEYQKKYGLETVVIEGVNRYGSLPASNEIAETGQLVIATSTMSKDDWVRTRAFSWIVDLFHFHKLLQIPVIVLRHVAGISYAEIFEFFSEGRFNSLVPGKTFPVLTEIRDFFFRKAREIQAGEVEYCYSEKWLNIYWPVDDHVFIDLIAGNKLEAFYEEAREALGLLCQSKSAGLDQTILGDAVELNRNLIKAPFWGQDAELTLSSNIWELYRGVLLGNPSSLVKQHRRYRIKRTEDRWSSWEEWYRRGVWYQTNLHGYLYSDVSVIE